MIWRRGDGSAQPAGGRRGRFRASRAKQANGPLARAERARARRIAEYMQEHPAADAPARPATPDEPTRHQPARAVPDALPDHELVRLVVLEVLRDAGGPLAAVDLLPAARERLPRSVAERDEIETRFTNAIDDLRHIGAIVRTDGGRSVVTELGRDLRDADAVRQRVRAWLVGIAGNGRGH